ncbi:spore germination protein KB [Paenibacillus intestini]|nr:spore germination protein KB [Paenibacillus intestini]
MKNERISPMQLFTLIILFDMGTALVVSLGIEAGKDAWLATLLGASVGLFLIGIYMKLYRLFPKRTLIGYTQDILGSSGGRCVGILYILFFIYGAARDLRDGADLLENSVLDQTPSVVITSLMMLTAAYVLNKGIEVLARTGQIFLTVLCFIGFISSVLLILSGSLEIDRILPTMADGWRPIVETTMKQTIEFPYSEIICFTMILPMLDKPIHAKKAGFAAVIVSGLVLSYSSVLKITTLGVDIVERSTFPTLYMISLINIGTFIQRLDVFVVLTLIIGVFFKISIFFYAAVIAIADIFRIGDRQSTVLPIGLLIFLIGLILSSNFAEHIEEGNIVLQTVYVVAGAGIPVALLMVSIFRGMARR